MFLKRSPRTHLALVKPDMGRKVARSQTVAKFQKDGRTPTFREFDLYQHVKDRNCRNGVEKWIPGVIV